MKALGVKLDAIVCNAGIMALPERQVAHGCLLDALAEDGRVVMLSSGAHTMAPKEGIAFDDLGAEKGYTAWTAYGQSKFANLLFAKDLARRFAGTPGVSSGAPPPGRRRRAPRLLAWAASVTVASGA